MISITEIESRKLYQIDCFLLWAPRCGQLGAFFDGGLIMTWQAPLSAPYHRRGATRFWLTQHFDFGRKITRSLLTAACLVPLISAANAQTVLYERSRLTIDKEIKVPTGALLDELWKQCPRLVWLQALYCEDKIARIGALLEEMSAKAQQIELQIASEPTVAQRKETDETIADINMSMRNVEGYIRNIRKKFSDHLAAIFPEPLE